MRISEVDATGGRPGHAFAPGPVSGSGDHDRRRSEDDRMAALLDPLVRQHDMLLETRRRDGSWVPTPVNPVVEADHVFFRTWRESGKAKRLRNDPTVHFAPSTARGRPTGGRLRGTATVLGGDAGTHAAAMINRKFPLLQGVGVRLYHRIRGLHTEHYVIGDIRPDG